MNTNERIIVRYANTRQMINEAERLIHEIERRLKSKRFVDRCLTRIDALREKLEDVPTLNNYEEISNLAEIDRERQTTFNNLMKDFVTISTNNKTYEDNFRIKDAQGRDLCDIYAMFSTRDLLPYKERSHRAYRIIYELINGQISRKVELTTEAEINDGAEEKISETEEASSSGPTVKSEETTEHESQESKNKSETRKATRSRVTKRKIIWNQRKLLPRMQVARAQPKDEKGRFVKVAKSGPKIKEMVTLIGAQKINKAEIYGGAEEEITEEASPSGTTVRSAETTEHESQESEDKSKMRKTIRSKVKKRKIIWNQRKSLLRMQVARVQPKDEKGRFVKVTKSGPKIKEMVTLIGAQKIKKAEIYDGAEEKIIEEASPSGTTVKSEETTEQESQKSEDKSETRKTIRSRVTKRKVIWNQRKSLSKMQVATARPKDEKGRSVKVAKSGPKIKKMVTRTEAPKIKTVEKRSLTTDKTFVVKLARNMLPPLSELASASPTSRMKTEEDKQESESSIQRPRRERSVEY